MPNPGNRAHAFTGKSGAQDDRGWPGYPEPLGDTGVGYPLQRQPEDLAAQRDFPRGIAVAREPL